MFRVRKAQCVLWSGKGHGYASIQKIFRSKHKKPALAKATIRRGYEENQTRGNHYRVGGNGRPKITEDNEC